MLEYSYNNNSLVYRLYGGGEKKILLLHDIGRTGDDFQNLVRVLSARATLIVPDLCGHGGSYLPRSTVSLKTMAREIIHLLRDCYLGRVDVIAAGVAGAVALEAFNIQQELFGDFLFLDTFISPAARRVFSESLRPVVEEEYVQFRDTFKRWVPAYREDFFIFCSEFDGRGLCRLCSSRMLFVYADRGRELDITRSLMELPEYSNIQICTVAGIGRRLLQNMTSEVSGIICRFFFDSGAEPEHSEEGDTPGSSSPDMGDLLIFR